MPGLWRNQLLIVDPPADVTARFRLEDDVAVLYTAQHRAAAADTGLPKVQTMPGGVAHLRVGEHFLDLYVQRQSVVVHFPALGIVAGGDFGSDVAATPAGARLRRDGRTGDAAAAGPAGEGAEFSALRASLRGHGR